MKKLILMALPALFALAANGQKKENASKETTKVINAEKVEEVKALPPKGKFKEKTASKIAKQKFSGPPPPKIERKKFNSPPPPRPPRNKNLRQRPKVIKANRRK